MAFKHWWKICILCVLGLALGIPYAAAQTATPSPVNAPVVPSIEIDSILYDEAATGFRVSFRFINQGFIGGLRIKVENDSTNTLVYSADFPVHNGIVIPVTDFTRGENYRLTVSGLDSSRQILRLPVPQSFGDPVIQDIQAAPRVFEYTQSAAMGIAFSRIEYNEPEKRFDVTLLLSDDTDAAVYNLWLQQSSGLIASETFVFRVPLTFPLPIDLTDIPAGQYNIVAEALNEGNEVLARALSDDVPYTPPTCNLVCVMRGSPVLIGVIAAIVLVLLSLLVFSLLQRPPKEYPLERKFVPSSSLIDEQDISIYKRESYAEFQKAPKLQLVLTASPENIGIQRVTVQQSPFAIGSLPGNQLLLKASFISGHHAVILLKDGRYFVRDMDSKNGTKLNSKSLTTGKDYELTHGSQIQFSRITFGVEITKNS
jgi:hypothetical protein